MKRIVHISDLHYGRVRDGLDEILLEHVTALRPDLVAVSGDLTQRARHHQFEAARRFLDRLPAPHITVPGNHDVPLENLFIRFVTPFSRYKKYIDTELEPEHHDGEVSVVGVNSVNPYAWQSGKIGAHTSARICAAFDNAPARPMRIVVLHHPLTLKPGSQKRPTEGAAQALTTLADCGADIVLSGHLHSWDAAPFTTHEGGHETLLVQAGTALSTRVRGEENDLNLLIVDGNEVTIERFAAGEEGVFEIGTRHVWRREGVAWRPSAPVQNDLA